MIEHVNSRRNEEINNFAEHLLQCLRSGKKHRNHQQKYGINESIGGITRRPATKATGTITVTGRPGSVVPAYTQAKDADGTLYQTTAAITLAGNGEAVSAAAPCEAVQAGALPDVESVQVTLVSAPSGVQAKAALTLAGGTDAEGNASMLTTLLDYMRNPPAGGTAAGEGGLRLYLY